VWPLITVAAARGVARKPLAVAAAVNFNALAMGNAHIVRSVAETGAVGSTYVCRTCSWLSGGTEWPLLDWRACRSKFRPNLDRWAPARLR